MRSYLNGSGVSTPPPGSGLGPGRPHRAGLMSGRASSSSLPRSPDNDTSLLTSGLGTGSGSQLGSGSGQSGHGSLGSHSSHEVSYMNIYQNTNHPHLYVSTQACKNLRSKSFFVSGLELGWLTATFSGI